MNIITPIPQQSEGRFTGDSKPKEVEAQAETTFPIPPVEPTNGSANQELASIENGNNNTPLTTEQNSDPVNNSTLHESALASKLVVDFRNQMDPRIILRIKAPSPAQQLSSLVDDLNSTTPTSAEHEEPNMSDTG